MKKFFEKNDKVKIVGILIIITVLLTWFIKAGTFNGSTYTYGEITRTGIFDFLVQIPIVLYYYAPIATFLIILGGFYALLSKNKGYSKLVDSIANIFKGKEILFVVLCTILLSIAASISNEVLQYLVFIPFLIAIMKKLNINKLSAYISTFGALLIGVIGSTYGLYNILPNAMTSIYNNISLTTGIAIKIIVYIAVLIIVNLFNVLYMIKNKKTSKELMIEEDQDLVKYDKETKIYPLIIVFSLIAIIQVMAFIKWDDVLGVTCFSTFHEWVMGLSIKEVPVISYILGDISSFGNWNLYYFQAVLFIAILIIKALNKMNFSDFFDTLVKGAKSAAKIVFIGYLVYFVSVLTQNVFAESNPYPIVFSIVNFFGTITKNANVALCSIGMFIGSTLSVEFGNLFQIISLLYLAIGNIDPKVIIVSSQLIYGLAMFLVPSSMVLMIGLTYLNISYKDYFKYFWKILLALLLLVIITISIIA